jgi:hypothetical protein
MSYGNEKFLSSVLPCFLDRLPVQFGHIFPYYAVPGQLFPQPRGPRPEDSDVFGRVNLYACVQCILIFPWRKGSQPIVRIYRLSGKMQPVMEPVSQTATNY